jgi:hypothetical protein
MSRGYRVTMINVSRTVSASDSLKIQLSVLNILPEPEMAAILCEELEADGWKKNKDGTVSQSLGGIDAALSADGKEVQLTSATATEVTARAQSQSSAEAALAQTAARTEESLKEQAMMRLTRAEPDVRAKLSEAIQRVYIKALKKKAESMGQVESVLESRNQDGEYEVTIKVKV